MMDTLLPKLQAFVEKLEVSRIDMDRQVLLQKVSIYIQNKLRNKEEVNLNFICTHNSRRSQLSQIWAQTAVFYFGIGRINALSGGMEITAFHPSALQALERTGFVIEKRSTSTNPEYNIHYSLEAAPVYCFSKLYDDPVNSLAPFVAVMTCADAEANCPYISVADARFAITYEDPKIADGSPLEEQAYMECNRQIATEMFYVFSQINKLK